MKIKAYVLLRTRYDDAESMAAVLRNQPGVVMVDQVEGPADIIFAIYAPSRKKLAELTVQAIASVEATTEDIQLLPVKKEPSPVRLSAVK